jgi:hypothetical protein
MDPYTHNDAKWGNRVSFMVVPFQIDSHEDPLEYVRQAKKSADRKKYSLEAIFIQKFAKMGIKLLGVRECTPTHLFFLTFFICSIDSTFAHMV